MGTELVDPGHAPLALSAAGDQTWSPLVLQPNLDRWAEATTGAEALTRPDLLIAKVHVLLWFFEAAGVPPGQITPDHVQAWQRALAAEGLAQTTIYKMSSFVSSFYRWALEEPTLGRHLRYNPVLLARPKKPKAYQGALTKALDDEALDQLLRVVRGLAQGPAVDVIAKRDYALLLFYLLSGMRRAEVIRLRWGDLTLHKDGSLVLGGRIKGGDYVTRALKAPALGAALRDYLEASGRWGTLTADTPLWVAHDRAQTVPATGDRRGRGVLQRAPGAPLTSHGFVKRLKQYAALAGLAHIHLHQTRHTYARLVSERADHLSDVQAALRHRNLATTRVYVQRVSVLQDKFSEALARQFGLDGAPTAEEP